MCCFCNIQTPVKKPGDGRKVTFFEPGSVEDVATGKSRGAARLIFNAVYVVK